jgi:hypothetical protein
MDLKQPTPVMPNSSHTRHTRIRLLNKTITIYSGKKTADALEEVSRNMDIYHGVRLSLIIDAVYKQGKTDGARDAYEAIQDAMAKVPYRNPGKPRKRTQRAF